MRSSQPPVAPAGLVLVLAACGSVTSNQAADAPSADAEAWVASCAPPAAITTVEAADAGFSNTCVHGQWYLQRSRGRDGSSWKTILPSTGWVSASSPRD